ncbi:hypothetical protein FA048_06585 [Pedobacter polaris]|uniref:SusE outer membrane protein domain-containing protein n=1 Tax=Pedobacter polaris TaxID=2571273 RepID=A0A4U1CQZ5_9SPHI|nr:SusE domain-containing protein [Pedobacter polaris]TKC09876.1 hypothetical protein FA048_06585 [Pedobacter polaris]
MKRIYGNMLMLMVISLTGLTFSCKKDKEINTNVAPVAILYGPDNNKYIKLDPKAGTQVFEWQQARAEDGGLVLYEVVFDKETGDFSNPLFSMVSDEKGQRTKLTISDADLNKIANKAGIQALGKGKLKWTVWASKGVNVVKESVSRLIEVERPLGFAEIPADLYLTGTATEGGADLATALRFKKTGVASFEIYTSLKAGTYRFMGGNSANAKAYSIANGNLVEGGEVTVTGATKVYRIRLDFENVVATYTEITSVGLWFAPNNNIMHVLPYTGGGIWKIANAPVVFRQESWGRDERYKFRLSTVNAAGTPGVENFGSSNRDNQRADANSPASYFYLLPVDNSQWDNTYKFATAADNKNCDIIVNFSSTVSNYTHSVTVK